MHHNLPTIRSSRVSKAGSPAIITRPAMMPNMKKEKADTGIAATRTGFHG